MNSETYLTIEDVAERFSVNATTVYRMAQKGDLPCFKVGSQWRFSPELLEEWVANKVMTERFKKEEAQNRNGNADSGDAATGKNQNGS